jgi:hypothetical protein
MSFGKHKLSWENDILCKNAAALIDHFIYVYKYEYYSLQCIFIGYWLINHLVYAFM